MFYDVYKKLCDENGEKPYQLPLKLGAKSNSMVAQWKKGSLPRPEMLQKIADHFKVTVGFLMDGETDEKNPPPKGEGIPHAALREYLVDQGVHIMLDADAKVTEQTIVNTVRKLSELQEKNDK